MKRVRLNLKLANCQVLLQEIERTKTAGGIIIPETADKDRTLRCRVLAMGPGELHLTDTGKKIRVSVEDLAGIKVSVGDVVLVSKFTHTHELDGIGKVRICKATEVIAVEG